MLQDEWENLASLLSIIVGALTAAIFAAGWVPRHWTCSTDDLVRRCANRSVFWFFLIPTLSILMNVSIGVRNGLPDPLIHDEFSYLLAADTFVHGRLSNPTPPFPEHFETPHELMRPTYMSKYPPGQGIALAIGQRLAGQPIVGVWLSTALACLAIYWMLLGFVSPPWALVGGIFALLHPLLIDWSRVYWGGSVAVLGGALSLGAWGRLIRVGGLGESVVFGVGLVILANSRPYEGLLLAAVLVVSLFHHASKNGYRFKLFAPAAGVLLIGAIGMGFYNLRVTGNPIRMPFVEYASQYDIYPKFWLEPTHPKANYSNATQQFVHADFEKGVYDQLRTPSGFVRISWKRIGELLQQNLKVMVLFLPLVFAIFSGSDRRFRWIWFALSFSLLGLLAENFVLPHYEAPITPLLLLLTTSGLAEVWKWKPLGKPFGRWLARASIYGAIVGSVMADAQPFHPDHNWIDRQKFVRDEPRLAEGKHLIFVTYAPLHSLHNELVFNGADLENSQIIWARSFGPEADLPVIEYFTRRQVWQLYVGGKLELKPYLRPPGD